MFSRSLSMKCQTFANVKNDFFSLAVNCKQKSATMACFMCNKFDEYGNEEIFNLKTRSTQLTVNEAIRKFIDFKTFDKRVKETTTICVTCLDRIDEYDDACLKLQQHESDLKEIFDGKKPWQNIVIENPCEEENDVTDNVDVDISGISIKFYEEMEEDDMVRF